MERGDDDGADDRKGRRIARRGTSQPLAQSSITSFLRPVELVPRKRARDKPLVGEGFEITVRGEGPAKRFRTMDVQEAYFEGEVPIEIVDAIMRMMGLKELIRMRSVSTATRGVLMHIMGREHDRPYDLRLKIVANADINKISMILDKDTTIAADLSRITVNDVLVEDPPLDPESLRDALPWLPGLMVNNKYYEVLNYQLVNMKFAMSEVDPFFMDLMSMGLLPETLSSLNGPYGTSRISNPVSLMDLR